MEAQSRGQYNKNASFCRAVAAAAVATAMPAFAEDVIFDRTAASYESIALSDIFTKDLVATGDGGGVEQADLRQELAGIALGDLP